MNILLTGATGFIGRNLVGELATDSRHHLYCVVRDVEKAQNILPHGVDLISTGNLSLIRDLDIESVVHLASYLTSRNDNESIHKILEANIIFGTLVLKELENAKELNFINIGSFAEYRIGAGKPESAYFYTAAKQAFRPILDYYAERGNWTYIHLIPYTVYGGKNTQKKLIDYVRESLDATEPVLMSPGYQVSDFIHINDVVGCIRYFLDHTDKWQGEKGEVYHLGTGRGTNIRDLARLFEIKTGKKCNIQWGAYPYRERDVMHAVAPIGKLLDLGWHAEIRLEDGI